MEEIRNKKGTSKGKILAFIDQNRSRQEVEDLQTPKTNQISVQMRGSRRYSQD